MINYRPVAPGPDRPFEFFRPVATDLQLCSDVRKASSLFNTRNVKFFFLKHGKVMRLFEDFFFNQMTFKVKINAKINVIH